MIRLALVALALAVLATPAMARTERAPSHISRVSCGAAGGAWRVPGDGGLGGQPQYAVDAWATYTYSCQLAGRLLVVRHRVEPAGFGPCSASTRALVSAWVDGVKVLSRAAVGEYDACFQGQPVETVVRVSLTARGVTVCRVLSRPAEISGPRRCRAVSTAGRRDPAYAPPRPRPPIRLQLTADRDAACGRWAAKLTLVRDGEDRSFVADEVPQARGWRVVNDGQSFGDSKSAAFDIDNDGEVDAVTLQLKGLGWRSHLLGLPATRVSRGMGQALFPHAIQPVRLDGRILVYLRALPRDGVLGNYDVYISERADTSRFLVEARPDGTTRLLCGWGPQRLREDAL